MKIRTIWRILAAMRNQEYNLADGVQLTLYWCYYPLDRNSYTKISEVPVSHNDFPDFLRSLPVSTITSEDEVKLSLSISLCNDDELTPSAAYTKYSIH